MPLGIVTLNQLLYTEPVANVLCFDNMQEDSDWLQQFADEIRSTANDLWDNHATIQWSLENITVSFIEGNHISYSVDVDFTLGNLVGNVITAGMPGGSAALISTSYVGAAPNRGRVYFAGLTEAGQANGIWEGDVMTDLRGLVATWADGFTIEGINTSLQILRRPSEKFPSYVANPVQFVTRTDVTRSQRRRNRGV